EWSNWTPAERSHLLMNISRKLKDNVDRLSIIETEEVGKPLETAKAVINGAVENFAFAATLARNIPGESRSLNKKLDAIITREPVGVVGLIIPWNFPLGILSQKLPYALAAGNTVVVKPSEFTSSTAFELAKIMHDCGLPKGVANFLSGYGGTVGQTLTDSDDIHKISFTGSTKTGRNIVKASAGNMKKISLELGGKSTVIVFPEADIEQAVNGALNAIYFLQGECCVSGSRLLVHEDIHDNFIDKLVEKTKSLNVGDPLQDNCDIGPMIHEEHREKVLKYIKTAKQEGAKLVYGGKKLENGKFSDGSYVQPTIFTNVSNSMAIAREEVFGPVLSVISFKSEEEAIKLANDTPYGLSASIWTKDLDRSFRVSKAIQAGTVWINNHIEAFPELPFGGFKESGLGREMGVQGLEAFT